jgi:hypothetical protein
MFIIFLNKNNILEKPAILPSLQVLQKAKTESRTKPDEVIANIFKSSLKGTFVRDLHIIVSSDILG